MADAQPTGEGTSSTPPAEPAGAAPSTPQAAPSDKPAADPVKATEGTASPEKPAEPDSAKPPVKEPPPEEVLFTLPDDFKPPEGMAKKFSEAVKGKWADGKLSMSPQQVADLYVELARDAGKAWDAQVKKLDTDNKAACEARFSAEELKAAEGAIGFFSSYEPGFRDFARRQLNDPTFTNAMRLVGELLSEDSLGPVTPPPKPVDNRSLRERAAEKLYGGKPS